MLCEPKKGNRSDGFMFRLNYDYINEDGTFNNDVFVFATYLPQALPIAENLLKQLGYKKIRFNRCQSITRIFELPLSRNNSRRKNNITISSIPQSWQEP